jgi:hypothetical protein
MGLVTLKKEEKREVFCFLCTDWGKAIWGHSKKVTICKQGIEDLPEPDHMGWFFFFFFFCIVCGMDSFCSFLAYINCIK